MMTGHRTGCDALEPMWHKGPCDCGFEKSAKPKITDHGMSDEAHADLVYAGRKLCDAQSTKGQMDPGYCGSVPRDVHDDQILDPGSWVHSSTQRWADRALEVLGRAVIEDDLKKVTKMSDRRLAVNATRRKNRNAVTR